LPSPQPGHQYPKVHPALLESLRLALVAEKA